MRSSLVLTLLLTTTVLSTQATAADDSPTPTATTTRPDSAAAAPDDALRRELEALRRAVAELEQRLDAGQAEAQEGDALAAKKETMPVVAYWKDDFVLSTRDESFWIKIRGNLHFDSKFLAREAGNPSGFDVRRARMDFQGGFYKNISFRVQAELADTPHIRNAWVDYRIADALHLRAGQMKPPFSTSWWTLDNNLQFIERGAGTPIYPYFDRGFWLWGELWSKRLTWNASVFNGTGTEADEKDGDVDRHRDFTGRVFLSPFARRTGSPLAGLHLCLEGTLGRQSVPTKRFEQKGYSTAIHDDRLWTWEAGTGPATTIDRRDRLGLELHYIRGPFALSSEYLGAFYAGIRPPETPQGLDGSVRSWSTWASVFLTGERWQVSNFGWRHPRPRRQFDPWRPRAAGAWEILLRYTLSEASGALLASNGADGRTPAVLAGADRVDELTVGLSWTWNPLVRWQINYAHINASGPGLRTANGT